MHVEILGKIEGVEILAIGRSIRDLPRLRRLYGKGHWRKLKGFARVRLEHGRIRKVEIHWYEAHGIGRREFKLKRFLPGT